MILISDVALGVLCFLTATIAFDAMHFLLHRCAYSRHRLLQRVGALHATHHRFLDRSLNIDPALAAANLRHHVIPEYVVQLLVTALFLPFVPSQAVYVAWALETLVFVLILRVRGFDVNHKQVDDLAAYRPLYFCLPEYHLLHHVYPDAHFSSWIKTLDHWLKTGLSLQGRHILLLGDSPLAENLAQQLRQRGAEVILSGPACTGTTGEGTLFDRAEILVLCHGDSSAGRDYAAQIEKFSQSRRNGPAPKEVWALARPYPATSPHSSAWQQASRDWYRGDRVIYRHLIIDPQCDDDRQIGQLLGRLRRGYNLVPATLNLASFREVLRMLLPGLKPVTSKVRRS